MQIIHRNNQVINKSEQLPDKKKQEMKSKNNLNLNKNNDRSKRNSDKKIKAYNKRTLNKENEYDKDMAKVLDQPSEFNVYLLPLLLIIAVLPLITKYKSYNTNLMQFSWFENVQKQTDFFLYYKQWIFIILAAFMAVIVIYKIIKEKSTLKFNPILIPVILYALMAILSAIFSKYKYFCIHGSMDQLESLLVLLGYCLVIFYSVLFIKSENDVRTIIKWLLVSVLILSTLGLTQFLGHDFFGTKLGLSLIVSPQFADANGKLTFAFDKKTVYLTMFNPNYVGVYISLIAPIMLVLLIFSKRIVKSLLYLLALAGLIICGFGSKSFAGLAATAFTFIGVIIFMWRYLLKRFYITIPVIIILSILLIAINKWTDSYMLNRVWNAIHPVKVEKNLTEIVTGDSKVTFTYKGNQFDISLDASKGNNTTYPFLITDGNNNAIECAYDQASEKYTIKDERFAGITFNLQNCGGLAGVCVTIEGKQWCFSNLTGDGTYYLYNRFNKWDKIVTPRTAIFNGYENIASGRGYLWARTIPLVKDYLFLGSGPDTYTIAFPQRDYVGFYNYGYESSIITKPHCLYLQIAVQTGFVSLLAFLLFYLIYFISSIRLYIRGRFSSYYAKVGVAIFIGTMAYMITGLTNDSCLAVAPVFWCLMGLGIAVNIKAKPLIYAEREEIKAKRIENKIEKKEDKESNKTE